MKLIFHPQRTLITQINFKNPRYLCNLQMKNEDTHPRSLFPFLEAVFQLRRLVSEFPERFSRTHGAEQGAGSRFVHFLGGDGLYQRSANPKYLAARRAMSATLKVSPPQMW